MITMVHGRGIWKFIMPENISGGPNPIIECIQRTLKAVEGQDGKLPPILFFQADNCWRESKSPESQLFRESYIGELAFVRLAIQ